MAAHPGLAEAAAAPFLGVVLLGSVARGEADELSDSDFIVLVAEGEFEKAWEQRHRLIQAMLRVGTTHGRPATATWQATAG